MDQQSLNNSVNYKSNAAHEKSTISKVSKEFKLLLFGVLNLLLKEDEISIYISGLFAIIEFLQALVFLFNPQVYTTTYYLNIIEIYRLILFGTLIKLHIIYHKQFNILDMSPK